MKILNKNVVEKGIGGARCSSTFQIPKNLLLMWESEMSKILWMVCFVGSVMMGTTFGAITYVDADNTSGNTTLNGAALDADVNYTLNTTRSDSDGLWAYRTDRTDVNGSGVWVTDGGSSDGLYDKEATDPLKVVFTLPEAGVLYDLYVIIMNNDSGNGRWDIGARIGDTGELIGFNRDSEAMTPANAEDFDTAITLNTGGDRTMKVLIGQYLTTTADESVSVYVNGDDTWEIASLDQRTRFDGVGYEVAPVYPVSPYDGETGVAVENTEVSWTGGYDPNSAGYYVYLGTDSETLTCLNPTSIVPVGTNSYNVGTIEMNTTYYWQIETALEAGGVAFPAGDPNNMFSDIWDFETVFSIPVITSQPVGQVADLEGSAQFEVGYESLSDASFAWYYSEDPSTETSVDDTYLSADEVLQLTNISADDEGYYYCVISNESGTDVATDVAALAVKRIVAYWTFDQADYDSMNNLYQDMSGEGHSAEPNGVPTFTTGFDGDAISVACENGSGEVTTASWATAGVWGPADMSGMFTVSFWIKWYGPDLGNYDTQNIISQGIGEDGLKWRILTNGGGNLVLSSDNANVEYSDTFLEIDTWVHCTIAFDGSTVYFYKNGDAVGSSSFVLGDVDGTLCLGGKYFDTAPEGWMNGELDEVVMYNYGLTDLQVAENYIAVVPGTSICVDSIAPGSNYDLNDDCVVDMLDFADFASNWLVSGIVQ